MLVTRNWLAQFLPAIANLDNLADRFTDIGLEVEDVIKVKPLPGVIVGRINSVRKIPKTKLTVCEVDYGQPKFVQVVCGAPNAKRGIKAPLVLPGTLLPNGNTIATTTIAGVTSEGMLCSTADLSLEDEADVLFELGRKAKPGQTLDELLQTNDEVFDLSVTPDRGDWLSMLGVAREISASTTKSLKYPKLPSVKLSSQSKQTVIIDDDAIQYCPKFTCMPISDVDCSVPTPPLILERLRRCGVRPVSIIVDITNYVMLELGQPLHAFDHDKLSGNVIIRMAKNNEQLELLDGTEAKLDEKIIAVCDEKGPSALGGVMGGLKSGVTSTTKNILLEGAHFVPDIVRGRCRKFNINSEAAFRFERGVDPAMCEIAVTTAAKLVLKYCGGKASPITVAGEKPQANAPIELSDDKIASVTGVDVDVRDTKARLKALGFAIKPCKGKKALNVTSPSWRFDIEFVEDLVEEVIRLAGYKNLPTTWPEITGHFVPVPEKLIDAKSARDRLVADGFNEIVTYAFVEPKWEQDYYHNEKAIPLVNPIASDVSVMRSGLFGGLLDRAVYNAHHRHLGFKLFELGRCFHGKDSKDDSQPIQLGLLIWGEQPSTNRLPSTNNLSFYDLAGTLDRLLAPADVSYKALSNHPVLHPGRSAKVLLNGKQVGILGELHPRLLNKQMVDLETAPVLAELNFDLLAEIEHQRKVKPVSLLPIIRRDLAVVIDEHITVSDLLESAKKNSEHEFIVSIDVFDYYSDEKIGQGKKSVGLRISMQGNTHNLVDEQITATINAIEQRLINDCGAKLRT